LLCRWTNRTQTRLVFFIQLTLDLSRRPARLHLGLRLRHSGDDCVRGFHHRLHRFDVVDTNDARAVENACSDGSGSGKIGRDRLSTREKRFA
jgi:hypothetical protein